jgi:hypothetical protein
MQMKTPKVNDLPDIKKNTIGNKEHVIAKEHKGNCQM